MTDESIAKRLEINGIVQGVGFRPFVFQLATRHDLKGEVANTASGVTILLEGPADRIAAFTADLPLKHPPLAHITEITEHDEAISGFEAFEITPSKGDASRATLISPDVTICKDCLQELLDPKDRRYGYPFINCTNCGPRYTIIDDIPYDRTKTSMRAFEMCPQCRAEYDEPLDRRFHAQPNACEDCGPQVTLLDAGRNKIQASDPIKGAADLLKQGHIVAVKGLGGYHLAVDATNAKAVARLRQRKHREEKPLALMSYDLEQIRPYAVVRPEDEALLTSVQRPIVLLTKKEAHPFPEEVSPRNRYFGVMLPYTPLHYLLLGHGFKALVMTSGNISEEPIAIDNDDAFERLADIAEYFLVHNREIYLRSDDSIVRHVSAATRFIRRSRGYVPIPVFLKEPVKSVLACGAELKNTVCLTKGCNAFVSQHVGDLENLATYEFFQLTIDHLKRILDIEPERIAYDLHPDYLSTRYATAQKGIEAIGVQHHHAHIVSCMAENKVDGPVIGLAFDGTGYGTDGNIWGGEVLVAEAKRFERVAHLAYIPMPGGAAAIKEPWRMAVSYLFDAYGEDLWQLDLALLRRIETQKIQIMTEMILKNLNCPLTSSLGRLFDGVAALIGLRDTVAFEGQAAMELEMLAAEGIESVYAYHWDDGAIRQIGLAPIIRGIVDDLANKVPGTFISAKFHATLVKLFVDLCQDVRRTHGLQSVALSGGVFQNATLLEGLLHTLEQNGFEVYTHKQVPSNDGGISLGQAVIADASA